MNPGIVIISLAVSYLIVAWANVFIKKIRSRKLISLIVRVENNIEMHKLMMGIFECQVPDGLYNQGELCISKLELLTERFAGEPLLSRVKKIREDYSKLKAPKE